MFWKNTRKCFSVYKKHYDVAIAYAQCVPTFYVSDCIKADKKIAWVNVTYKPEGKFREYNNNYYKNFESIVCVSNDTYNIFKNHFPEAAEKSTIIYDINDADFINKLSNVKSLAYKEMDFDGLKILTVGRLAPQKGYDLAIEAGETLKANGINYKWYILGRGPLEEELKKQVNLKHLDNYFVFLGTRSNPYPYYKEADIYVQTSKFEGFGLAIAEARMLNIPVVTTNFSAVKSQMIDGENGLITDLNGKSVAEGIQKLINDEELYNHIREYQSREKKGNLEEIDKFYDILET